MVTKLLQAIEDIYNKKYIGYINVKELNPIGFDVSFGNPEKPTHISAELNEDKFIKYFVQELRDRHLYDSQYFETRRI